MAPLAPSSRSTEYHPINSAGPFPVGFPVYDGTGADLFVSLNGVEVGGWTFSGSTESGFYGNPNTWIDGAITFPAPVTGTLFIDGLRAPRRQAQFREGGGVPARDLNHDLNVLTAVDQELLRGLTRLREGSLILRMLGIDGPYAYDARHARITSAGYPQAGDDVATRSYVESVFAGNEVVDALEADLTFAGQNSTQIDSALSRDSRAFYVPGFPGGWFADYDCKAARVFTVRQAEDQVSRGYGGFRDGVAVHHADEDVADYTGLFQNVSMALRGVTTGKFVSGVLEKQYKDLVGADFHAIGRIDWPDRGVSGIATGAVQAGRGIASNEFAVENPSWAYEQSLSMAAVQAIVRQKKAPSDSTHKARGVLVTNDGYSISAGVELMSVGGLGGVFETGLDLVGAFVSQQGIRMPQTGGAGPAHAGTLILYDGNDYSGYDRALDRFFWVVNGDRAMSVGHEAAAIGDVDPSAAVLTLAPCTTSRASLLLTPGVGPFGGPNGSLSTDGTDLFFVSNGSLKKIAFQP